MTPHLITHLTSAEAARRLRITKQTVRNLVARGELSCIRTPLGLLFDPEEIDRYKTSRGLRKDVEDVAG